MRALALLIVLSACSATGGLKSPNAMTDEELCTNAELVVTSMIVGGAWPSAIESARVDADNLCGR